MRANSSATDRVLSIGSVKAKGDEPCSGEQHHHDLEVEVGTA